VVIAAEFPFLEVVATMAVFFAFVIWVWMIFAVLTDVFRRHDIGGWLKALWVVGLIVFPLLGTLVYLIRHHAGLATRSVERLADHETLLVAQARAAGATNGEPAVHAGRGTLP